MPSKRFATKDDLLTVAGGAKSTYEPKDSSIVHDASYVHTDNNFSNADKSKLDGLYGSYLCGTCSTGASVAAKEATVSGLTQLANGVTIQVKFANENTASAPTLNVSGTGAKAIYSHGTTAPEVSWSAGSVVSLTYIDGAWVINDAMTEQIKSLQSVIANAKSLLGNLGLDANGNPLVSAATARATLDAAQSESATGSLADAEDAITAITGKVGNVPSGKTLQGQISTLQDSVSWTNVGNAAGGQDVTLPNGWTEVLLQVDYNSTYLTSSFARGMIPNYGSNVSLGNYGTSYAVGRVSPTKATLATMNWAGQDVTSSARLYVYCKV